MNFRKAGLVIFLVLLIALYFVNRKEVTLTAQDGFLITAIGDTGYELKSVLHLHNPNLLSATIKTISEKFYIEGREVAILNAEISQGILGMKETSFPVTVRFSKKDLLEIFPADTVFTIRRAEVNIIGEMSFETMMSSGKISINQKDSVAIPAF